MKLDRGRHLLEMLVNDVCERGGQSTQKADVQVEQNCRQISANPNERFRSTIADVIDQFVGLQEQSFQSDQDDAGQDALQDKNRMSLDLFRESKTLIPLLLTLGSVVNSGPK
jgi:uncharacterized protein (UPF0305 family)